MPDSPDLADLLLDAQVAWVLDQLAGDALVANLDRDVDDLFDLAGRLPLDAVLTAEDAARITTWLLEVVPPSVTTSTVVEAWAAVVHEGPSEPYAASDLIAREHVEALVDEVLAQTPALGRRMDRLADSPAVGAIASRFISRIVVDVLQANQKAAERIPGMGSIMSLGTSAASKVIGAAERPLQAMGDTAGKGAAFAVRRLNAVVVDTLQDPMLKQAVMEVWDRAADDPLDDLQQELTVEDVQRIAALLQDITIAGATTAPVAAMVEAFAGAFFAIYGEYPVATLLDELGITAADVKTHVRAVVPTAVAAAHDTGWLAQVVRDRLAPFFHSPEVRALLSR